jgi:hypothetical protein
MCMTIKAPTRDIGQETADTLAAEVKLAPDQYAAAAKYDPMYADLNVSNFARTLTGSGGQPGLLDLYTNTIGPAQSRANAAAATAQRGADVGDLEQYGQRAVAAIKGSDPQQAALMGELNSEALSGLQQGANLDPSLARQVSQSVRAGQAARGLGLGPSDVADEALFTGLQAQQLRQQRQGFATQVAGMNAQQSVDPLLAIVGRPSQANPALLNQGAAQASQGLPSFDPMNPYAQDYWNTTYNARSAAKIAGNNANAALWGQAIQTVGGLVGAGIGACWVAREVYGQERDDLTRSLKWEVFREWMLNHAPKDFRTLYLTFGEQFAEFIKDKPELKAKVREFMDGAIANWRRERKARVERGDYVLAKGEY